MKTKLKTTLALLAAVFGLQAFTNTAMADDPTPPSILDDAYLWLDASQGVTTDDSGMVTSWTSRNSGGKTATSYTQDTQVTAGPTVLTGVLGGKNVVDFGAARSHKDLQFEQTTTIRTVFMVAAVATDSNNIFFLGDNYGSGSSKKYDFHRGDNGTYFASNHGKLFADGTVRHNGVAVSGPSGVGVPTSYGLYTLVSTGNATANCICQDRNEANRNGGKKVAELIIFNSVLSDSDRAAVEQYLMTKWLSGYPEQTMLYRLGLDSNGEKSSDSTGKQSVEKSGTASFTYNTTTKKFDSASLQVNTAAAHVIDSIETTKEQGWTFSFWFYSNGMSSWADVLAFAIGNKMGKFEKNASNQLAIYRASEVEGDKIDPGVVLSYTANTWTHVAMVSTATGFDVYCNGTKASSVTVDSDSGLSKIIIGNNGFYQARTSSALVDDVSVFNWSMTSAQVNKIKNSSTHASMDLFAASKATVTGDINWSNLTWTPSKPASGEDVKLTREGDAASATLTLNESVNVGCLTVESAAGKELKIANFTSNLTATSFDFGAAKGGVGIDVTSGWTVVDPLKSYVRDNEAKVKFYGANDTGATLDYARNANKNFNSHLVFEGGTHTFKYGMCSDGIKFSTTGSVENPTLFVKSGTLNYYMKDMNGWSGNRVDTSVVRVGNGATMNILQFTANNDSMYMSGRLVLEPGSTTTYTCGHDNGFRIYGGADVNKAQIYVPAPTDSATVATLSKASGSTKTLQFNTSASAITVDAGATLQINDEINGSKDVTKGGAGTLEFTGTVSGYTGTFTVSAGTLKVPTGRLACPLTLSASGATVNITGETGLDEYVITSGTFTPGSGTVLLNGAALSGYVVDGNKIVKSVSYAAKIGDTKYETVAEAMTAVTSGQTITLLKSVEETLTAKTTDFTLALDGHTLSGSLAVPTGSAITLNLGSGTLSSTLTGSGTIIYDSTIVTNFPTAPSGLTAANWTGTVWFKGYTKNQFNFSSFANTNSKIKLTGFKGYAPDPTSASTVNDFEFILEDDGDTKALTINDGYSNKGYGFYFGKLTGTGTFTNSKGVSHCYCIKDGASFAGTISTTGPLVVFGETVVAKPNDDLGYIFVQNGKTATIAANKTWSATHGLFVNEGGTIAGSGTCASAMTFENNATIDTRNGVLTAGGSLTFGAHTKIRVATEPDPSTPIKVINKADAGTAAVATTVAVYVGESETPFTTYAFGLAYNGDGLYLNVFSTYRATVSDDTNWSAISWTPDPQSAFPTDAELIITNTGDSATITMDADVTVAELLLVSASGKETTFAAGAGAVSIGVYEFEETAGKVTVGFSTGGAAVTAGNDTVLTVAGSGNVSVAEGKTVTLPGWTTPANVTGAGDVKIAGAEKSTAITWGPNGITGNNILTCGTWAITESGQYIAKPFWIRGENAVFKISGTTDILYNAGDKTSPNPICVEDGGEFQVYDRDTCKRAITLSNGGKMIFDADDGGSGRSFDFYTDSSLTVNGTTPCVIRGLTEGSTTASGIIAIRRSGFTVTVDEGAELQCYSAWKTDAGSGGNFIKAGDGKMVQYRDATSALPFVVSGGTLKYVNGGRTTTAGITLNSGCKLELSATGDGSYTLGNAISGAGRVEKQDSGTYILSGANTYEGATVVSAGTLILTGSSIGTGDYTVASGATLDIGQKRGLTINGEGGVWVTLTDAEATDQVATMFSGYATITKVMYGGTDITSKCTISGGTVKVNQGECEATVGTVYYLTLAGAISQATEGSTITLLKDAALAAATTLNNSATLVTGEFAISGDGGITVASGKTISIANGVIGVDLGGSGSFDLTGGFYKTNTVTLAGNYRFVALSAEYKNCNFEVVAGSTPSAEDEKVYAAGDEGTIIVSKTKLEEKGYTIPEGNVQAFLNNTGANSITNWQNVVLGLSNTKATDIPYPAPIQGTSASQVSLKLGDNVTVDTASGATVTYKVQSANTPGAKTWDDETEYLPYTSTATIDLEGSGVKYYRFDVLVTPAK